jgi:TolB-like protein
LTDIFISYARPDRDKIAQLSTALERAGWTVWWDRHIDGGAAFARAIETELGAARAVVVAWSQAAVQSDWVKDEAASARDQGKLVPVSLDGTVAPLGFRQYQVIDLSAWTSEPTAPAIADLLRSLETRLTGAAPQQLRSVTPAVEQAARPPLASRTRTVKLAALAVIALLGIVALVLRGERPAGNAPTIVAKESAASTKSAEPATTHDKTIAVLPFADFSAAHDQEWFADGLAEEILNALSRTPDLRVSARTSSFRYKGSALAIPQIARELGVAHVLEGSIRSTPQRIRVTAQLIRAADGFQLWSQTYDRDPADIIEIQEDLARSIAVAMQTTMDPKALADMAQVGTRSVEAYQAYIRGVASRGMSGSVDVKESYELFEKARALDPGFAAAHAEAASFWLNQLNVTTMASGLVDLPPSEMEANFTQRIRQAIEAAATPGERAGYEATAATLEMRWRQAIGLYQARDRKVGGDAMNQLLELAVLTSDRPLLEQQLALTWQEAQQRREVAVTHVNVAYRSLDFTKAADQAVALLERWPDNFDLLYQAHRTLLWDGRVEAAADVMARIQRVLPADGHEFALIVAARQACAEGRRADVEQMLAAPENNESTRWHLLQMLGQHAAANELLMPLEREGRIFALSSFLAFPNFDPSPFPSLLRILEREQVRRPPPVPLPFACPPRQ